MDCEEYYHRIDKKIPRSSSLSDIIFLDEEKRIIVETIEHEGIVRISQQEGALVELAQNNTRIWEADSNIAVFELKAFNLPESVRYAFNETGAKILRCCG